MSDKGVKFSLAGICVVQYADGDTKQIIKKDSKT